MTDRVFRPANLVFDKPSPSAPSATIPTARAPKNYTRGNQLRRTSILPPQGLYGEESGRRGCILEAFFTTAEAGWTVDKRTAIGGLKGMKGKRATDVCWTDPTSMWLEYTL
ncbi:hypothetical protein FS749_005521 [Ceratobasidium sp. UAMH 11750]|nr:hypothetical protein FS749_005521 [Ceratobasidium sp. UAMH 11750]